MRLQASSAMYTGHISIYFLPQTSLIFNLNKHGISTFK